MLKELLPTLRLKIMNIGFKEDGTQWVFNAVNSPFSRFYLVTAGMACTRHHGRTFRMQAGQMHIVPCFTLADYYCPDRFSYGYIHFTARMEGDLDLFNLGEFQYLLDAPAGFEQKLKRIHQLIPGCEIPICKPHTEEQKRGFLKQLDSGDFAGSAAEWLESDGLFREVLAPFLATFKHVQTAPDSQRFKPLFKHIEEHLAEDLSLADLARVVNLHPTYFSDLFHKTVGVRPIEFLHRRKIERAQILMLAHGASVKEAAYRLGFADPAYFSRLFRKYTGMSPSQYVSTGAATTTNPSVELRRNGGRPGQPS